MNQKFHLRVINSLVLVYLPKIFCQNEMINYVPPKCTLVQVCLPKSVVKNGMIH
jgi:hypothetical protein